MNTEAEARLTALVVGSVGEPKCNGRCALNRAEMLSPRTEASGLSKFAQTLGFTEVEAWGIMDGWDMAEDPERSAIWGDSKHLPGYADGYALGAALHTMVCSAIEQEQNS